jgi:hypothetical protein
MNMGLRRWFRFRLRTLLLMITLCGVICGTWLHRAERQRRAVAGIEASGGRVFYDYQWQEGDYIEGGGSPLPDWLLAHGGRDLFHSVVAASMGAYFHLDRPDTGPGQSTFDKDFFVSDATWGHLQALPRLEWLDLNACNLANDDLKRLTTIRRLRSIQLETVPIDGRGLAHLADLPRLEELSLSQSRISDDTLDGLLQIRTLQCVGLQETRVTRQGMQRIAVELPACRVYD